MTAELPTAESVVRALLGAAADSTEESALCDVAMRAGLMWLCPCGRINHTGPVLRCQDCHRDRYYSPGVGEEYTYVLGDYAQETARVLGAEFGAEFGYLGAYGHIWGPSGGESLRLWVDAEAGDESRLRIALTDGIDKGHEIDLPGGAPNDGAELRTVAEIIAATIRANYTL
ncbi:hypothetical protein [Streptomyces sp. MBT27]|uniref:hypothetical protein n=1 Tax=Streptomyces sp. MBT27 TaxID=1488356 RepID=UPI001422D869|nr:hypothetical protein [Streptomyces sp. MBT27]